MDNKVVRKPMCQKSSMVGAVDDYKKIYNIINNWNQAPPPTRIVDGELVNEDGHFIWTMRYSINEAPYFGWLGEKLTTEREIFHAIQKSYTELLFALEDALGIESKVDADLVDENGYYKTTATAL